MDQFKRQNLLMSPKSASKPVWPSKQTKFSNELNEEGEFQWPIFQ